MTKENKYQIVELTKDTDDKVWQMRLDFYNQHKRPHEVKYDLLLEFKQKELKNLESLNSYFSCLVLDPENTIASFTANVAGEDAVNQKISASLTLKQDCANRNLFETILKSLRDKIQFELPVSIYTNRVLDQELCHGFNLTADLIADTCLLKREDLDYQVLKEWQEAAEKLNPDLRMCFYPELPEDLFDEYAALFTELENDMPGAENSVPFKITGKFAREVQERAKVNGTLFYRYLAFNAKNQLIAKSNVRLPKRTIEYPYQFMTGVKKEYRGRMIGKWLKSVMYPKIFTDFPEVKGIVSEMRPENAPIKNMNSQIGYKKIGEFCIYLMNKEDFNKWRTNHEIL